MNRRFMFQAMVTRLHSPRTQSSVRSKNCRKPSTDLMMKRSHHALVLSADLCNVAMGLTVVCP